MTDVFGLAFDGPPFILFSTQHLVPLAAVALIAVLIAVVTPRLSSQGRNGLRWLLVVFCLANWLGWDLWQRAHGLWSLQYSLPLHLCTFAVPFAAVALATARYRLCEVLYFWAFAGSTQAMLTPDLTSNGYNFPHFVYWIFWTSHGVLWWAAIFAIAAWGYRPTWGSILRAILATNLLLLTAGVANWLTGGNYMFVARTPEFSSLIDFLGPWPWYILSLQLLGIAAFVLVYLPYAIKDWLRPTAAPSLTAGGGRR